MQTLTEKQMMIEDMCARIKAADDAAADRDYMLDSDDCISVLRGTWKWPLANDYPQKQDPASTSAEVEKSVHEQTVRKAQGGMHPTIRTMIDDMNGEIHG